MSEYGTPPPNQPPPGQPPTGPYGGTPPPATPRKGFFGALFDFSFEHFITPIIVKIVYVLALAGLLVGWLVFLAAGFAQDALAGVLVLVLGPVAVILYLAFIRMTLEFYLAIVRMSEDIHYRMR
jgi:hypothetical protein